MECLSEHVEVTAVDIAIHPSSVNFLGQYSFLHSHYLIFQQGVPSVLVYWVQPYNFPRVWDTVHLANIPEIIAPMIAPEVIILEQVAEEVPGRAR